MAEDFDFNEEIDNSEEDAKGMIPSLEKDKITQDELIIEAKNFFNTQKKQLGLSAKKGEHVVRIDFEELSEQSPELAERVIMKPDDTVKILEVALHEGDIVKNARVRLLNLAKTQEVKIRNIRAKNLDTMISIEGIVRQASEVRPKVSNARFECPACGTIHTVLQLDEKFREPTRCSCGRRGGFRELEKEMVDAQRLVLEESPDSLSGGEQPKRMTVFLKEDLVEPKMEEKTTPGCKVKVIGVLKEVPIPAKTGGILTRFELAIEANNITPMEESYEDINISEEDEEEIKELAADPKVLDKIVESIAPSVWGYPEIKESLALQMFGGVQKRRSDGTQTRGDIHVLLVGDPGVAKSVMLKFISGIAPKGRYVSGKSASGAGLTATVVKDEFLRGWALEAGAMVLSNKGLVCIDELEKMDANDRSTMHEAMEQQCMLPDFKLMLSNGEYVKIGEFVDNLINKNKGRVYSGKDCEILPVDSVELLSTDFNFHFPQRASRVSRHIAPKEFIKLELSNGREITVTPEHPCWVVKDGKIVTLPAEKLTIGEFFPIPSKIEIREKKYETKNDFLCKILGYHISDGCYELNRGKKTGIQFWNNNKELIEDYKLSINKYFNIDPIITKRKEQFAVRVIPKRVFEEMQKIDPNLLEKGTLKRIPYSVMNLPKENIKFLLRALYDGDGSVSLQNRNGCRISLVSENRELSEQVTDLLLRFEIQASIFWDTNSRVWRVDISGQENLTKFLLNIGFLSSHKQDRLRKYCEREKTYRTITDLVPNCTTKINAIFKKLKISARKEIGHSIDLGVEKQRIFLQKLVKIALEKAIKLNDQETIEEIKTLERLAFGFSRWTKIKNVSRIKNEGIKWVYDVTIEPHHTFISNGMILHNTVTISKANVQATLRAQTAVLAAANPKFGRFDPHEMIAKQVDLAPSLLNRFDVLFILRDLPSRERDESIAAHVLQEHKQDVHRDIIQKELLRKYVAYAKQKCHPVLTDEAIAKIKHFYVGLRNQPSLSGDAIRPIPISARQLEALVRLAEAISKSRLGKKVTEEDAQRAINLMRFYMMQVGYDDETKSFDIDKISGNPASKRNKIHIVKEILEDLENRLGKLIPQEEIEKAAEGKISKEELEEAVDKLVRAGDLFRPRRGYIQRM